MCCEAGFRPGAGSSAKCWAQLEAATLMVMKAATLFDRGQECGVEANTGKYLAGEGGMGYAQEYHVERYLRESLIPRTAPVSPRRILTLQGEGPGTAEVLLRMIP